MKIFCSTIVSRSDAQRVRERGMGVLCAATASRFLPSAVLGGIPLAVDNGAFGFWRRGVAFNDEPMRRVLTAVLRHGLNPEWLVAPDIVAGGRNSLEFSIGWAGRLSEWPLAVAVQDGMEPDDLLPKLHLWKCVFVGGSLHWKWHTAAEWASFAQSHGLQCHIGRVGTLDDMVRAQRVGATSCDSSTINRGNRRSGLGTWSDVDRFLRREFEADLFHDERTQPQAATA